MLVTHMAMFTATTGTSSAGYRTRLPVGVTLKAVDAAVVNGGGPIRLDLQLVVTDFGIAGASFAHHLASGTARMDPEGLQDTVNWNGEIGTKNDLDKSELYVLWYNNTGTTSPVQLSWSYDDGKH